jgi:hypothetical protein
MRIVAADHGCQGARMKTRMKSKSTMGTACERKDQTATDASTGAWGWTTWQPPPRYSGALFRLDRRIGDDVCSADIRLSAGRGVQVLWARADESVNMRQHTA